MMTFVQGLLGSVALAALAVQAQPVQAQSVAPDAVADEGEGGGLKDIVVTAQRKAERLQDVPIAVNVVSGAELAQRGTLQTTDLPSLIPALSFTGYGATFQPFLRGVGSGVGTPGGTMHRWMSTPSCGSPCLAAGIMMGRPPRREAGRGSPHCR